MTLKAFALSAILSTLTLASVAGVLGEPHVSTSLITWDVAPGYDYTLTISGAGQVDRHQFDTGESPALAPYGRDGQPLADGSYTWQLTAAPQLSSREREIITEARAGVEKVGDGLGRHGWTQSGAVTVSGGAFVVAGTPADDQDGASFTKDTVFDDAVIVSSRACIGTDCVDGQNFGYENLRLKANNVRILFEDTSDTASFPSNDWEITINDRVDGGLNRFSIHDVDASPSFFNPVYPFTIEAGAGADALYIDDRGNVGLGTATPEKELQIKAGDSPAVRFEQDGSDGFSPSTWDVGGNEANFFARYWNESVSQWIIPFSIRAGAPQFALVIGKDGNLGVGSGVVPMQPIHISNSAPAIRLEQGRLWSWDVLVDSTGFKVEDVTTDTVPFRIEPGAPTQALAVAASGNVGLGTDDPKQPIHIKRKTAGIALEDTDTSSRWHVSAINNGDFAISRNGSGGREFQIEDTGDVKFRHGSQLLATLDKNGNLTTTGTVTTTGTMCGGGCDLVFQPGYDLETIEEHAAFMWRHSYLPAVGPTVENGEAWNLTEKTGGMLNELEKAHIYIERLNSKIGRLNEQLQGRDALINGLVERMARFEALLEAR